MLIKREIDNKSPFLNKQYVREKYMKLKWMAVLTLAASTLFAGAAFAADGNGFSDVDFSTEQGQAIEKMYSVGYLSGYNDGTFKPDATITRAELTRVFNQVFKYELNEEKAAATADFTDVDKNAWYYNDVRIAQTNGYINGFNDGTFRPQENFTRQQTCVTLALAAGLQNTTQEIAISDEVSPWAENYVKAAIADGAFELEEGNTFRATTNITRGEVCEALAKYVVIETEVVTDEQGEAVTNSEGETETATTVSVNKSNSGSSGGSSGGGSSSGGSSSGGSTGTTTATEATTESTTAATDTTGSTTTTTTTTEATTEATTEETPDSTEIVLNDEEIQALRNVISDTRNVLMYRVRTSAEKEIVQYILESMESYLADNSFDVTSAISEAKNMYYDLSAEEKEDFQHCVTTSYDMMDVVKLQEVFAPLL